MLPSNCSKSLIYWKREVNSYMADTSISQIAYILALIGGILLVIFGLLDLIGFTGLAIVHFSFYAFTYAGIVSLICGVIAIIGARSASTLVWAIVLIIVGIIGGGIGGLLVVLGGLLGIIVVITKRA
jgi:hypothetical protein